MLALLLLCPGCVLLHAPRSAPRAVVGTPLPPPPALPLRSSASPTCSQTPYLVWGGLAVGFGALAGASGVATLAPQSESGKTALAITSVVVGVGSAVSTWLAGNYAAKWTKCTGGMQ